MESHLPIAKLRKRAYLSKMFKMNAIKLQNQDKTIGKNCKKNVRGGGENFSRAVHLKCDFSALRFVPNSLKSFVTKKSRPPPD